MKKIKSLISLVAVAATAALLLAGCQQGKHEKDKALPVEQTEAAVDTTEEDAMAANSQRHPILQPARGWLYCQHYPPRW